jgi:lactoylglutathione lyase/glyoxylase I family protein
MSKPTLAWKSTKRLGFHTMSATMSQILSLAHVCIFSTDLAATEKFYCGALGMKKAFDFTRKGEIIGFYLKAANSTFIEVFLAGETETRGKQVLSHLCLQVESLPKLHASLVSRGYAPRGVKLGADHTPQFWMPDPNGMDIEFQQYVPESAQVTGANVEVDW